jgi:hypothetical protein
MAFRRGSPSVPHLFYQVSLIVAAGTLGIGPVRGHIVGMSKSPRVIFSSKRIADGDWQIEAHCPGAEIRYIKGLISKADIDEWLAGERRIAWLRSQGYAK